jgi:NAD(P)-dependent dehydrogenase (short-subunit alcohol dehydrogenase family)
MGASAFIASMASLIGLQVAALRRRAGAGLVRVGGRASPHGVRISAIAPGWIESDMPLFDQ